MMRLASMRRHSEGWEQGAQDTTGWPTVRYQKNSWLRLAFLDFHSD
jgi:hypothetical protein